MTGEGIDEGLAASMPGPRSYTGEDVVEVSCHGNPVVLAQVVEHVVRGGARLAEPGEFTRRAFVNGRIDLIQAEAVALLIGARSEQAARLAARQLEGSLSREVETLRDAMVDLLAGLEVALDFPDDELGWSRTAATARAAELVDRIDRMLAAADRGRLLDRGLTVMLTGAPNVGKSSLLNALLARDRAIVSPIPGTTRDMLEGETVIGGVCVRLMDGAGLAQPHDALEAEGMARTRRAIEDADLVVIVLDGSRPRSESDEGVLRETAHRSRLIVVNKIDLGSALSEKGDCRCSALSQRGVAPLREAIENWVEAQVAVDADEGGIVASIRVRERLAEAHEGCTRARNGLERGVPTEAVLVDIRDALHALEEAHGSSTDEAILDRIFATFCVGK